MGKVQNITTTIAVIFIGVMLFLMIQPMDFLNENIEQFHDKHEGLIWSIGLILGALIAWRSFANHIYQKIIKKCMDETRVKNDLIASQNEKILKYQQENIIELRILNQQILKNSEKDLQTLAIVQKNTIRITKLENRKNN